MTDPGRTSGMAARHAYLRQETAISIVINLLLSLAFFLGMFRLDPAAAIPIDGNGGYAVDLLPQSVMIALMSTLVPGAITARRISRGKIHGVPEPRGRLVVRSVLAAAGGLAVGGTIALVLVRVAASGAIAWTPALGLKLAYGAALGAIVTPIGLRAALRRTDLR